MWLWLTRCSDRDSTRSRETSKSAAARAYCDVSSSRSAMCCTFSMLSEPSRVAGSAGFWTGASSSRVRFAALSLGGSGDFASVFGENGPI